LNGGKNPRAGLPKNQLKNCNGEFHTEAAQRCETSVGGDDLRVQGPKNKEKKKLKHNGGRMNEEKIQTCVTQNKQSGKKKKKARQMDKGG